MTNHIQIMSTEEKLAARIHKCTHPDESRVEHDWEKAHGRLEVGREGGGGGGEEASSEGKWFAKSATPSASSKPNI